MGAYVPTYRVNLEWPYRVSLLSSSNKLFLSASRSHSYSGSVELAFPLKG